jgi:hypothetical protein
VKSNARHDVSPLIAVALAIGVVVAGCGRSAPASPTSPSLVSASSPVSPSPASPAGPFALLPDPVPDATEIRGTVVIISIDGLRPDAVLAAPAFNILALTRRGSYSWSAQTILPSTTLPSHTSMLSGFLPEVHGVTWDDYVPSRGPIRVPTVFSAARAAGRRTALFAGKEKFTYFRDSGCCDVWRLSAGGDQDLAGQAAGAAAAAGLDLLVVHLPEVDLTGHANQWMSQAYLAAVRRADNAVGRIVSSLPPNATLIVTADHGGRLSNHGSADPLDMTIPWIIVGPTVARGRMLSSAIRTVDTAATAAYVLGLPLAAGVRGRPVLEAFAQ